MLAIQAREHGGHIPARALLLAWLNAPSSPMRAAQPRASVACSTLHKSALHTIPAHTSPQVLVCPADEAMAPAGCTDLPLDLATMERPGQSKASKVHLFSVRNRGLEDPRPFVWRDRVHLLGTVHVDRSPR